MHRQMSTRSFAQIKKIQDARARRGQFKNEHSHRTYTACGFGRPEQRLALGGRIARTLFWYPSHRHGAQKVQRPGWRPEQPRADEPSPAVQRLFCTRQPAPSVVNFSQRAGAWRCQPSPILSWRVFFGLLQMPSAEPSHNPHCGCSIMMRAHPKSSNDKTAVGQATRHFFMPRACKLPFKTPS